MTWRQQNAKGQFARKHQVWSLGNFEDGYADAQGRFRVYLPDHPRSCKTLGYIFRSIAAYEAYHGISVPPEMDVHHKDHDRLNDSIENLEMIDHLVHARAHAEARKVSTVCVCERCSNSFVMPQWKVNAGKGRFCNWSCRYPGKVWKK